MRGSVLVTALLLASPLAAASPEARSSFQLEVSWGRTSLLTHDGDRDADAYADAGGEAGSLRLDPRPAEPDIDVGRVLRFQPRIIERAPYEPGVRKNDNVATAVIAVGGAAILTSIIVDWLHK